MTAPSGWPDLSPSPDRVGRACAWIERADGGVLLAGLEWGGWTLPGGGIVPGETAQQAAVREAWEECGAHAEVCGEAFAVDGGETVCVPLRLTRLEASPEGRPVRWVNPASLWWSSDRQLREALANLNRPVPPPALCEVVRRVHRLGWVVKARLRGEGVG